ncbi:MAG: hypothetical protein N5P05_000750 [Chroococcopsis gigantea SAG 12.99]|jgi:hypothetical protein|nr:hypothetical protein [Chlorogloea purpurea SAG 13.99]MDV2999144.1 hypothetical protein [Chroococcopsis gigantea SAG 12.99]
MKLDAQLNTLTEKAPGYGVPSPVMSKGVNPVLKAYGGKLSHSQYYILETVGGDWLLTTLTHRLQKQEKTVLYAFATPEDAEKFQNLHESSLTITSIPVTHLLFELFALPMIHSIIFMDKPGNLETGVEIYGDELRAAIKQKLQRLQPEPPTIA